MTTLNSRASKVFSTEPLNPDVFAIVRQQPSLRAQMRVATKRGKDPHHLWRSNLTNGCGLALSESWIRRRNGRSRQYCDTRIRNYNT